MTPDFSIPTDTLYFNSANLSYCPNLVLDAISLYRREFEHNPTQGLKEAWGKLWKIQEALGEFLGANPKDLILRSNITEVLNTFILGHPIKEGDEILVGELEYGAITNICRFRSLKENLKLRVLKIPQSQIALARLSEEQLVTHITSQFSPKTKVLVLSHVIASLGLKIPIEKIARITRQRKVTFVVDGAYAPGALPVDFNHFQDIDYYGCSLYKWLLGPKGTAFGWVNPIHHDSLSPLMAGWTTFESAGSFAQFGQGNRFQEKFQLPGCRDFAPFYAIKELLDFWSLKGAEEIRQEIFKLNQHIQDGLKDSLGISPLLPSCPSLRAPMTVFRIPEKLQASGAHLSGLALSKLKVQLHCTPLTTGWHGVISPHIYNTEKEIETLITRLKSFFNSFLETPLIAFE